LKAPSSFTEKNDKNDLFELSFSELSIIKFNPVVVIVRLPV
jgi:hypothetical protein